MTRSEKPTTSDQPRICAVVMECNPFHEGHQYILQEARERTHAKYQIVVMSGDFVQRGEPAIEPKEQRARDILSAGADLVIELPLYYACSGAGYFARGAVTLIDRLHCVTDLVCGSESGDGRAICTAADLLAEEPAIYQNLLREALSTGLSFPAARARALSALLPDLPAEVLSAPNDTLALEYARTLRQLHSTITLTPVPRISGVPSASDLRRQRIAEDTALMTPDLLSMPLLHSLLQGGATLAPQSTDPTDALSRCLDVEPDLARRMRALLPSFVSWPQYAALLKTRNNTYTHISRALLHILLGMRTDHLQALLDEGLIGYARVLGFRRSSAPLLHRIKETSSIPLITRTSEEAIQKAGLSPLFAADLHETLAASTFYDLSCRTAHAASERARAASPTGSDDALPLPLEPQKPLILL